MHTQADTVEDISALVEMKLFLKAEIETASSGSKSGVAKKTGVRFLSVRFYGSPHFFTTGKECGDVAC